MKTNNSPSKPWPPWAIQKPFRCLPLFLYQVISGLLIYRQSVHSGDFLHLPQLPRHHNLLLQSETKKIQINLCASWSDKNVGWWLYSILLAQHNNLKSVIMINLPGINAGSLIGTWRALLKKLYMPRSTRPKIDLWAPIKLSPSLAGSCREVVWSAIKIVMFFFYFTSFFCGFFL